MVVKDKVGRNRYVAFRVEARRMPSPVDFGEALRAAGAQLPAPDRPKMILLTPEGGLVRCRHTAKEGTIALLRTITAVGGQPVSIQTVGTSGTIRRARRKYLKSSGPGTGE